MLFRLFILLTLLLPTAALAVTGRANECNSYYAQLGEKFVVNELVEGPRVLLPALANSRNYDDLHELKFVAYNVLNLDRKVGAHERDMVTGKLVRVSDPMAKPDWAKAQVAQKILEKDPDIVFLEEVEGLGALTDFNKQFLSSKYRPVMIQGNDERGIQIGILVKKDLPLDLEILSQANRTFTSPITSNVTEIFSRDAPVVLLRKKGSSEKPMMAMIGAHLKSQRDAPGDIRSVMRRTEQAKTYVQIIQDLKKKYPNMPIVVSGDFNADLHSSAEFKPFWNMGIKDVFDLISKPLSKNDRTTFSFHPLSKHADYKENPKFPGESIPIYSQIDGVLVSQEGQGVIKDAGVMRYTDANGKIKPLPERFADRETNPSDHFPIFAIFDWDKIKANFSP